MGTVRKPLYMSSEGFGVEMPATDNLELGGLSMSGNIVMANNKITGLGLPSGDGDAASKIYVDTAVISGGRIKEALTSYHQLDNTDGINAAEHLYFDTQPGVGDSVVFKNGTLTRTYTFVANIAGESAATDVSIETSAATAMARLILRANADAGNTQWDLVATTGHADINSTVIIVLERATGAGASTSRIYTSGAWADPDGIYVVKFATAGVPDLQYTNHTAVVPGTSDPGQVEFGFRRQVAALLDGEIHFTFDSDEQWSWNGDASEWFLLAAGAVPDATSASGGGIHGKVTADSDYGLTITGGVMTINVKANTGLAFGAGGDLGKLMGVADGAAGIAVGANGFGVVLATNPGLAFGSGGDAGKLKAYADGAHGIVVDATGIAVELDPGAVAPSLGYGANGLKVLGVPATFTINGAAVSANVTQTNMDILFAGAASYADALHNHTRVENAKTVSATYSTNEAITKGDPVYWQANDAIGRGDASVDAKAHVWGVAVANIANPGSGIVTSEGVVSGLGGGLWTVNDLIYLAAGGGLTNVRPAAGSRIIVMGFAKNTSDLFVDVKDYGKRAA